MSLAYKLWKIGSVLEEKDIKDAIKESTEIQEGKEPDYVNIDFQFENMILKNVELSDYAISKENMFFTKKIGGSGSGIYYLFPNLNIQNETLEKKFYQLIQTINNINNSHFANGSNKRNVDQIIRKYEEVELHLEEEALKHTLEVKGNKKDEKKLEKIRKKISDNDITIDSTGQRLIDIFKVIIRYRKWNYWFWFSINGKSFCKLMPEIWDNWYQYPAIRDENAKKKEDYDSFTNEITEIGYRPEIKVFSYDNYHENLKFRINENLPLSLESAKHIKFGWIYILKNLVFHYKGFEYIIVPNFLSDNPEIYKSVLKRFTQANKNNKNRRQSLTSFEDKEKKLNKEIEQYDKKKSKQKNDIENLNLLKMQKQNILEKIKESDPGFIEQINSEIDETGDLKNSITIDYLFVSLNRTDLSFEIKGSIEDVIPSQISKVVRSMSSNHVCELVTLKKRDQEKTYLQDFFNRNELYFALNRSSQKHRNTVLKEKLYLIKLLLNDEKIKFDDLLSRFEKNREFNYENKKRLLKDGIKEWISFPDKFIKDENNIRKLLMDLDKIKE